MLKEKKKGKERGRERRDPPVRPLKFKDVLARIPDDKFLTQGFWDKHLQGGPASLARAEEVAAARSDNPATSTTLFLGSGDLKRLANEARAYNIGHEGRVSAWLAKHREWADENDADLPEPKSPSYVSRGTYTFVSAVRLPAGGYQAAEIATGRVVIALHHVGTVTWQSAGGRRVSPIYGIVHLEEATATQPPGGEGAAVEEEVEPEPEVESESEGDDDNG